MNLCLNPKMFVVVFTIAVLSGIGYASTISGEQAKRIDRVFEKWNHADSPGCALAVMQNGEIIYKHGYGMADLEHGAPITPATPFHVASVSKQFTAAAIVLLAQQGRLSIDDDVRKYIPELPDFGVRITIRNLLHHTSGLRDQWDLLEFAGWRYSLDLITNQDVLDVISRQKELNFRPGDRFLYSNTGYTLLGEIVHRISGKSLREFTTERIFRPLGMSSTHFRDDHAELIKGEAYGYVPSKNNTWRLSVTNFDTVGATSLFTTVEDLSRWDQNFYNPKVGGAQFLEQMMHRDPLNGGQPQNYAFGLVIGNYHGLPTLGHDGADAGYRATFIRFPNQSFSIACLCNAGPDAQPGSLAHRVADVFLAKGYKVSTEPSKIPELTPAQLERFTGAYWNANTDEIRTIMLSPGKLQLASGADSIPLHAIASDVFRLGNLPIELHFFKSAGGKPSGVRVLSEYEMPESFELLPPFTLQPGAVHEYSGDYVSDEIDPVYRVTDDGTKVILKRLKHEPEVLDAKAPDLFSADFGTVHFIRDARRHVSGMLVSSDRVYKLRFRKKRQPIANLAP